MLLLLSIDVKQLTFQQVQAHPKKDRPHTSMSKGQQVATASAASDLGSKRTIWIIPRWSACLERGDYVKGHDPEVSKAPTRRSCLHDMTSNVYMSLRLDQSSHGKAERSGISGTGPPCSNLRHMVWNGVLSVGQAFFNFLFFGSPPKHQRETYHESNNIGGRPTNFQQASFSIENLQIPYIP